jgi:KDO2-lipid IV(A) lauroyltransferase
MELLRSRWRRPERILDLIDLEPESERLYRDLMELGRGVVFVGGHYGNWELLGARIAAEGYQAVAVAQNQRNPLLNRELDAIRTRLGIGLVHRGEQVRKLIRVLRAGGAVMLLADQEAGPGQGIFADFFGRPASTFRGPATFAVRYRIPLLAGRILRTRGRYSAGWERLDDRVLERLPPGSDEASRVRALTDAFNAWLEEVITGDPRQYLWLHRRWEIRPAGGTS